MTKMKYISIFTNIMSKMQVCVHFYGVVSNRHNGLTFAWWVCCGLCPSDKPTELAHSFYSVLVSISVFMALSTVFHSINSPDNSPFSRSVLSVLTLALLVLSTICLSMKVSFSPDIILCGFTGLKAPTN